MTNFDEVSLRSVSETSTVHQHSSSTNLHQLNCTSESVELRDLLKVKADVQPISRHSTINYDPTLSVKEKASDNEHVIASQRTWPQYPFATMPSRKARPSHLSVNTSKDNTEVGASVEGSPYCVLNRSAALGLMNFRKWRDRDMSVDAKREEKILSVTDITLSDQFTKDNYNSSQCETLQIRDKQDKQQDSGKLDQFTDNGSVQVSDGHCVVVHAGINQHSGQGQHSLKVQSNNTLKNSTIQ